MISKNLLLFLFFLNSFLAVNGVDPLKGRGKTISGYVRDASSGEVLIAANIYAKESGKGTLTNSYGFYSLTMPEGKLTLGYSYVGYQTQEIIIELSTDQVINIDLSSENKELEEVVITATRKNENISRLEMGSTQLQMQAIRRIPAFMGEVDVIKAIQLLPGVQSTSEGASGFSVRGGSSDQNLILLDEAVVYNASHFLGFFSVFNNDAIKDVKLYKGDIPASTGGRLSSVLDVRMKEGNLKQFSGSGGTGTISSRLTLEGPIIKDRTSFIVSGRRTYADLFLPLSKNEDVRNSSLYFYDLNAKVNHVINDKNRIFFSGYFGRDFFKNPFASMGFGNRTLTGRWNHLFNNRLFANISAMYSYYDYKLGTPDGQPSSFEWLSLMKDHRLKADFSYFLNPDLTIKFGWVTAYNRFEPGTARGTGTESLFTEFVLKGQQALENGLYLQFEQNTNSPLSFKYGLRFSSFHNFGNAVVYNYDQSFNSLDSTVYSGVKIFNSYYGLEPRLGINYTLNDETSLKASYSKTRQYLQLAQNSTAGTPLDIWFPASPNIKPQISDQVSVGIFRNFSNHTIETSLEAYYKKMQNTIDFKDHPSLLLNPKLEGEVRVGESWSYGLELLIKLRTNRLNGWMGYTLSRTERKINFINNGEPYLAPYDKPHNLTFVLNYSLTDRLFLGSNWIYSTGIPVTFPTGRFEVLGVVAPVYSSRNAYRMPDYHRLDFSLTLAGKEKSRKKWNGEWVLSVYNAYARKNAWAINFVQDSENPGVTYAEMTYLFSIIPAITYNFNF